MKEALVASIIPIVLAIVGAILLYVWLGADTAINVQERLPIAENLPQIPSDKEGEGIIQGLLVQFDGKPADLPGAWPRFRGANFDAISSEDITLAKKLPPEGPKVLWSIDVGEGYAAAAVLAGRVYILDYDREKQADVIRCLSLTDGSDIWQYSYPVKLKRNHGMSRTIPAVTDRYIVTMGPRCHVTCLDSITGRFRWMLDLVKDFNAKVPDWYAGQCPLIDDNKAIIAVGGDAIMMAVNCETGEILWRSPNPHGWLMTHSSIMLAKFGNKRMYVYCASGGVVGISAENGGILWDYPGWTIRVANVPSPLVVGEGLIFLSGGYNAGSTMLQLTEQEGKITAQPVFKLEAEVFGSEQQTPIFYQGHIYGIRPDRRLVCLDLNGQVLWTSPDTHLFGPRGLGPYTIANGMMYILDDSGVLTLAEATPNGYVQLAEAKVMEGIEAWGPMAVASNRLILRDMNKMMCIDIGEQ